MKYVSRHENGTSREIRSEAIARRLGALTSLSPAETDLLRRIGAGPASAWAPGSLLQQAGSEPSGPRFIISGWAARVRDLQDGRRQIVQVLLPGDSVGPHLHVWQRRQAVQCVTAVRVIDGAAIKLAASDPARFPGIAAAVELAAAHDRGLLMEQVLRLGRQSAFERMANLFLELHYRCSAVGLVHDDSFSFPLTQEGLGDLLGLSVVHVNRTLQLMRRQEMIQLKHGRLTLTSIPALSDVAEFRPPQLECLA